MLRELGYPSAMNIIRIIAATAFLAHVLMGCGWHQHGDVSAKCSVKSSCGQSQGCESSNEQHAPGDHSSQPSETCEVEQCVYLTAPHVDVVVDWNVVPLALSVDTELEPHGFLLANFAAQSHQPHVRRHVALNYFLN